MRERREERRERRKERKDRRKEMRERMEEEKEKGDCCGGVVEKELGYNLGYTYLRLVAKTKLTLPNANRRV